MVSNFLALKRKIACHGGVRQTALSSKSNGLRRSRMQQKHGRSGQNRPPIVTLQDQHSFKEVDTTPNSAFYEPGCYQLLAWISPECWASRNAYEWSDGPTRFHATCCGGASKGWCGWHAIFFATAANEKVAVWQPMASWRCQVWSSWSLACCKRTAAALHAWRLQGEATNQMQEMQCLPLSHLGKKLLDEDISQWINCWGRENPNEGIENSSSPNMFQQLICLHAQNTRELSGCLLCLHRPQKHLWKC